MLSSAFHSTVTEKRWSGRNYVLHPVLEVSVISQVQKHAASPLASTQCSLTGKAKEQRLQCNKIKLIVWRRLSPPLLFQMQDFQFAKKNLYRGALSKANPSCAPLLHALSTSSSIVIENQTLAKSGQIYTKSEKKEQKLTAGRECSVICGWLFIRGCSSARGF